MCNQNTTSTPSAKSNFEEELAKLKVYVEETAKLIKETYKVDVESYLVFESTNLNTHQTDGWFVSIRVRASKLTHTVYESSVSGRYIENWRALFDAERWFVSACEDKLDITYLVKPKLTI